MDVNFELKPWILDYAEDFAENANNADISEYMRDAFPHPCTKDDAERNFMLVQLLLITTLLETLGFFLRKIFTVKVLKLLIGFLKNIEAAA